MISRREEEPESQVSRVLLSSVFEVLAMSLSLLWCTICRLCNERDIQMKLAIHERVKERHSPLSLSLSLFRFNRTVLAVFEVMCMKDAKQRRESLHSDSERLWCDRCSSLPVIL